MSMLRPLPALVLCAAACTLPGYEGFTSFEPKCQRPLPHKAPPPETPWISQIRGF